MVGSNEPETKGQNVKIEESLDRIEKSIRENETRMERVEKSQEDARNFSIAVSLGLTFFVAIQTFAAVGNFVLYLRRK